MKKVFQKIIIGFFIISFLFAPLSVNLNNSNNINLEIKTAQAQTPEKWWFQWTIGGFQTEIDEGDTLEECNTKRDAKIAEGVTGISECSNGPKPTIFQTANLENPTLDGADYLVCWSNFTLHMVGCVASFFYTIWEVSAWIAEGAGRFLDFFVYYSTNSDSYRGDFVEKGWAVVRDIANIFFIIALLFVAIKTVLSMNVSNNKRLVGMIIVVALLINFSLFTAKVVIDSSNILAKIFYNNITPIDKDGKPVTGEEGEQSISVGIIRSYNPQDLLSKELYEGKNGKDSGAGYFIFLTIVLLFVTLYTAYIFIAVALLFLARVISLWIAMIFAPIAFTSYTIPFNIPGLGHRTWWTELLKNAFLAPLFIFFLYLIILFLKIGTAVTYTESEDIMIKLMSTIIPFAITVALLMKAKELAVKMSGEMGGAVIKGAQIAGGFALGAVTGGAAMMGSGLIGGGAAKLMGKYGEKWKSAGYTTNADGSITANKGMGAYFSRMALKTTDKTTKASFDMRQTKLGQKASSISGMNLQSASILGLGSKKGGFQGAVDRKVEKIEKEKELYKTSMSNDQVKEWSDRRRVEYYEGLDKAKRDKKGNMLQGQELANAEKAYKAKYGEEAPKAYTTADELNKDRMNAFRDNIGHSGLLGSIASEVAKGRFVNENNYKDSKSYQKAHKEKAEKEYRLKKGESFTQADFEKDYAKDIAKNFDYDKDVAKKVNDAKINQAKMVIGGTAVLAGTVTGGLVGGGIGSLIGTGVGAGAAGATYMVDSEAEKKVATNIDKQNAGIQKINDRIQELNDIIRRGQELNTIKDPATGAVIGSKGLFVQVNGKDTDRIDKEKLRDEIAKNKVRRISLENILKLDPSNPIAEKDLTEIIKEEELLNSMKTVEDRLFDLTGKKADMNKPSQGGNTPPPAPATPPSTP